MAKPVKPPAPDHLTMRLFAPGMSALHRAGLGGLACTLKALERHHDAGLLGNEKLPGPVVNGDYPWEVTDDSVALRFGKPELASDYLKKLFAFAFQIRDGVMYLPGQYPDPPPSLAVRAAIQDGIQNTFLHHGPTCGSRDGERLVTLQIGDAEVSFSHDVFTSYKHQGWFWLDRDEKSKEKDPTTGKKVKTGRRVKNHQPFPVVSASGELACELHEIDNKLSPGGMVRHDSFKLTAIRETDAGLICLHFALVGCLTLCINRVTGALLVPEVRDLCEFSEVRALLTPRTAQECRIAGAADAALQADVRLRARLDAELVGLPGVYATTCKPTKWNEKQKPRVGTCAVRADDAGTLTRFERALAWLPARLIIPKNAKPTNKRQAKAKQSQAFWADSVVRPLVAENLARGREWYAGFVNLYTKINPATDKPFRDHLPFERGGLHAMIADEQMWDEESGAQKLVQSVHEAMRRRYGQIAKENESNSKAMEGRMKRFREKLRLDLAGAKTESQVRFVLSDLFSRGGINSVLREHWGSVLRVMRKDWQLVRDLGLLALASYPTQAESPDTETPSEE